jgi:nucleoid-associated protein YgaU
MADNAAPIWARLKGKGLTDYATAGVMGNFYAESGLIPNNLEQGYEKTLGYTDETYTKAVDSGAYANFANDSAGYGLAQWTFWTLKRDMLAYAKAAKGSIGDLNMQIDFFWSEMQGEFAPLLAKLQAAKSAAEASTLLLTGFERPADQGAAVQAKRAAYGQGYYDRHAVGDAPGQTDNADFTIYIVKNRDTLYGIAKSELGDGSRYVEIAELNGIKDPYIIKTGQVLKLPTR